MNNLYICSFGITPTMEKLFHRGTMHTVVDDCQFVCIAQSDYYKILHQVSCTGPLSVSFFLTTFWEKIKYTIILLLTYYKWYSSFKLNVDTEMVDYKIQFFIFRYLRVSST